MPVTSTFGALTSRAYGEFANTQPAGKYIEDYFSTYLYTGKGADQNIENSIPFITTSAWSAYKLYQGSSSASGIATDSANNFYVCAIANDSNPSNYFLLAKYNSAGVLQWQRSLRQGLSAGYAINIDSADNIYVGGVATDTSNYGLLAKYDASGTLQWQRKFKDSTAAIRGISTDGSGNVYITGNAQDPTINYMFVAKYNGSGALQWQRKIRQGSVSSVGFGISSDSSGNSYAIGYANDGQDYILLVKYDTSGSIQWQRKIRQGSSTGYSVKVDNFGNIYISGVCNDGADYALLAKYNSSGTLQWQRKFSATISQGDAVFLDSSGYVYLAGAISVSGLSYGFVAKYDSSGNIQWQNFFRQAGGYVKSIAQNSFDKIYLYGGSTDPSSGNGYSVVLNISNDGSSDGGTAFVTMTNGTATDAAGTATDSAGTATDTAGTATDSAGTATDTAASATSETATQSALNSAGGMVWVKSRSAATDNVIYDTVRGATNELITNSTAAQTTQTTGLTSFNGNGFSIGSLARMNTNAAYYSSWSWRKEPKFFDIVEYTGNGSTQTINHNLGSVPGMIIVKQTSAGNNNWPVYHRSSGAGSYINLNTTDASISDSFVWNNTLPTSTVFSVGANSLTNTNGATYIAYLFAHDAGGFGADGSQNVISCGSFTTGNRVTLGYEPQFILSKLATGTEAWLMNDSMRGLVSANQLTYLQPNSSTTEVSGAGASYYPDATGFTPTGFTAGTHIYLAIRRGPMKTPTDATKVFQPVVYTGTNVDNRLVDTTIAPDMVWCRQRNDTVLGGMVVGDRLRGVPYLRTGGTNAEVADADSFMTPTASYGSTFSAMNGFGVGNDVTSKLNASTVASNQIAEAFKRAPGFFDVVAYTGTGSNTTVSHNLGVIPELMLIKQRASTTAWGVYAAPIGNTNYLVLNTTAASAAGTTYWNSTTPTSSVFSLGTSTSVNASGGTYVSYLYASCPGVSKVGSYIGTGTTNQINCGFTAGARFVLIKRTDSTGDWYVYDSARGIVAGNDPYLLLNSTAAEVTNTDYVDTYSAGFELSSTAPAGLNEAPGITWVSRTSGFTATIASVSYGNGLYIAGGDTVPLTTSTDGITWTSRTVGFAGNSVYATEYGNGLYVIGGGTGKLSTSTDGINWTPQTSQFGTDNIFSIAYGNGLYIAVGQNGKLSTSPDGVTWTSRTSGFGTNFIYSAIYANGLYIIGGDTGKLSTSTDGITWTSRTSGFSSADAILGLAYGNGVYVAVGESGVLTTSTDGITWTSRTSGFGASDINGVTFGDGRFIIVGAGGRLSSSTDGITWTSRTTGTSTSISRVTYGSSGGYVAVGSLGLLLTNNPSYLYLAIA